MPFCGSTESYVEVASPSFCSGPSAASRLGTWGNTEVPLRGVSDNFYAGGPQGCALDTVQIDPQKSFTRNPGLGNICMLFVVLVLITPGLTLFFVVLKRIKGFFRGTQRTIRRHTNKLWQDLVLQDIGKPTFQQVRNF